MGRRRSSAAAMLKIYKLFAWVRRQSMKVKIFLAVTAVFCTLVALKFLVKDRNYFIVVSEAVHVAGLFVLIYKLITQKSCSGLSLKTQLLTALFITLRLCCLAILDPDIHTLLDVAALVSTLFVMYLIRFELKSTYTVELDNMPLYYVLLPCAILAIFIHPHSSHSLFLLVPWAFCVFLEAVAVLPQLRMMQNTKAIEPFTALYVFALGVSRFLQCAHWLIQVYETAGVYFSLIGSGYIWLPSALLAEIIQTFILADFCYYYVKSVINGRLRLNMPLPV